MRAVFFPSDTSAVGFYRMYMPSIHLNRSGLMEAYISHSLASIGEKIYDYGPLFTEEILRRDLANEGFVDNDEVLRRFDSIDTVIYHRQANVQTIKHMEMMKKAGKYVLVEHDDFLIDYTNPTDKVREHFHEPIRRKYLEEMYSVADGIVVSTDSLAECFKTYSDNVMVCPNSVDIDVWPDSKPVDNDKVIFAGSFTHRADLDLIKPLLTELGDRFHVLGFDYPKGVNLNWVDISQYPKTLSGNFVPSEEKNLIPLS